MSEETLNQAESQCVQVCQQECLQRLNSFNFGQQVGRNIESGRIRVNQIRPVIWLLMREESVCF